jgi:hypothetical protein
MQGQTSSEEPDPLKLKSELARLRVKRSETKDLDIRNAIGERIAQIEAILKPEAVAETEVDEPEIPAEPPSPQQMEAAEALIRQSRVEKMRENKRAATDLLKQAAAVAPGSPTVLEALADDMLERRQMKQAIAVLKRASALDPKNVGLERKYAIAVAQTALAGTIEDQMRMNLSDSAFADPRASSAATIFLSLIWPGLGHVVIGRRGGYAIMAIWLICSVWLFDRKDDLAGMITMAAGHGKTPGMSFVPPLVIMVIVFFSTIASLGGGRKAPPRKPVDHPMPPVDKPFEL